jgi:hypothetical protein
VAWIFFITSLNAGLGYLKRSMRHGERVHGALA